MTRMAKRLLWIVTLVLIYGLVVVPVKFASFSETKSPQEKEEGKIIAKIGFDPKVDGFGFENYGNEGDWEDDLTAADLIKLFGADEVCEEGSNENDCVLYETAQEWLNEQLKGMDGGHCEGMAVASLRFYEGKDFQGKKGPHSFQGGAESVFDLKRNGSVRNYIAHYFVTQFLDEVSDPTRETSQKKPSEVLDLLVEEMKNGKDTSTLGIYKLKNGERADGHAITPIGVEEVGDDEYRILVYDNNYPGETKFITLNKKEDTWRYRTSTKPGEQEDDYEGDASSHTLELTSNSLRDPAEPFQCPFGDESESKSNHAALRSSHTRLLGFAMEGQGDMLITDDTGKRVGFDFNSKKFVNEAPGSKVIFEKGGLHKNVPPEIEMPIHGSNKPYTIAVSGKTLKHGVDADLVVDGPGFVVGFKHIMLDPGETLTMGVTPDGRELSFTGSQDGQTPDIFITVESGHKHPSYEFDIGGLKLNPGKMVTMRLDLPKQKLFFKDNDGKKDKYTVKVVRVNPDGGKSYYEHDGLSIGKADNYEMDFSKWDGKGGMCFEEDEEDNGFEDNKCVDEPNEAKPQPKKSSLLTTDDPFRLVKQLSGL
jgi:hypothetical protein